MKFLVRNMKEELASKVSRNLWFYAWYSVGI
jgi:hypothetical protein